MIFFNYKLLLGICCIVQRNGATAARQAYSLTAMAIMKGVSPKDWARLRRVKAPGRTTDPEVFIHDFLKLMANNVSL